MVGTAIKYRVNTEMFIRRVIRHRKAIIGMGRNERNLLMCLNAIDYLTRHLKARIHQTNKGMAIYFQNNKEAIRYLIKDTNKELIEQYEYFKSQSYLHKYL